MQTKTCRKCKRDLPIDQFYLLNREKGYRRYACIECTRAQNQQYVKRDQAYWRAYKTTKAKEAYRKDLPTARDTSAAQTRKYNRDLRRRVLDLLGRACPCGYCADERALHVDHVNGGGTKHKRESFTSTAQFHRHILDVQGKGYQILCATCNWRKRLAVCHPPATKQAEYSKNYDRRLRNKAIAALGSRCPCGESDQAVLHFDHRDGGGHQDRKRIGRSTGQIARDVLRNPTKYQLLCPNCNQIKKVSREECGRKGLRKIKSIGKPRADSCCMLPAV